MHDGHLSPVEVDDGQIEGMRNGPIADPALDKTSALADAFGVDPSYIFRQETVGAIAQKGLRASEHEKQSIQSSILH